MLYALFHWFVKITGYIPQLFIFRTKVHFEDRSVQRRHIRSRAIVVSNHNGLMDFAVLLYVFFSRTLRCIVAEVTFDRNFLISVFLKMMGCIRVDRSSHDTAFLDRAKEVLDRGGIIEMYPEARIPKKGEARPLEFKPSYVYLALESGAPIIPVYNNGKAFSRKREQVVIGKPINVTEFYDCSVSEKENVRIINNFVRSKIIELGKMLEE